MLKNPYFQRLMGGSWAERFGIRLLSVFEYLVLNAHKDRQVMQRIRRTRWERRTLVTFNEAYLVHSLAQSLRTLPGEIAEVGVYEGSTARLLCEAAGDKSVHLFDTFEGLPEGSTETEKIVYGKKSNMFRCSLESVSGYLQDFKNVSYYRGLFPESASALNPNLRFALVHLDVDLYQSTLSCLQYFYPLMTPGGIIISHDYSVLEGVSRAFHEFLADKSEQLIDLPTTQAMIIKR